MSTPNRKPVQIPDGYMQDQQGNLVPVDRIKEIDLKRDEIVKTLVDRARDMNRQMTDFKTEIMKSIEDFVVQSGKKYQVKMGGNKGNVTLMSFDGRYKIERAIAEHQVFDERLQVAKQLIDECIHEWTDGARSEIRVLINDAFKVDKQGQVSTSKVLGLRRHDIKDRKWKKAMEAISDSVQVANSKAYIRVYERVGDSDQYTPISLNMATV